MRIGIDARVLQGEHRGQRQYTHSLIRALLRVDTFNTYKLFYNGFKARAMPLEPHERLEQVWCRIPGRLLKRLWEDHLWPPVELLMGGDIDIFHNTINYSKVFYAPLPTGKKMVATYHGMPSYDMLLRSFGQTRDEVDKWLGTMKSSARRVITVSELAKKDLIERASIPEEKISVVYPGVDPYFRPARDMEILERAGLKKARYLFYVGGMEANKNLESLLRVFNRLRDKHDILLILAGKVNAERMEQLKNICRKGIVFPGEVLGDNLRTLLSGALAFVLPTLCEPFGLPVLEAMGCGTPVIASKYTGALEIAGDAALSFDPADQEELQAKIENVLNDSALRARLKEAGLAVAARCTWDKTAREVIKVYEMVKGE